MTRELYEQKIKELEDKFPYILSHDYDEYKCRYYACLLDIQFEYITELEKRIGIKDRYKQISKTDAFKKAYVDKDIGETLEIKEDL